VYVIVALFIVLYEADQKKINNQRLGSMVSTFLHSDST